MIRRLGLAILCCGLWIFLHNPQCVDAQTIYQYKGKDATICFFDRRQSQYIPHLMRKYQTGRALHSQIWGTLPRQAPFMMLSDWEDDGNAGVSAMPHTFISIGMAPLNMSYFVGPSNERYDHLFKHEYTHVVMTDKTNSGDDALRGFTGNKVVVDSKYPLSTLWSYFDTPRWYAPRWYHEGIACFLETWLGDGAGRALGGYDETWFRTLVRDGREFYSIVGLETEGSTSDFQQGATAYLYGTRFVNYLALTYGYDKLIAFYNRTEDSSMFYATQFEKVYGKTLKQAWSEWMEFEKVHQKANLEHIAQYPLTETVKMTERNLGAMSPMIVDEDARVAFAAVNYPGDFPQIIRMTLDSDGKVLRQERLAKLEGAMSYQTAYIAYDKKNQRLFWTDRNFKMRGLVVYDLRKNRIDNKFKYRRMYDICYDNVHDCLYGLLSNQGVCSLVKYDSALENLEVLYSFPFGVSVNDLDVSHDGTRLVASLLGTKGQHSLIMFDLEDIENANHRYRTLYTLDDANLSQFRFSADDSRLLGFSYYTGVPNVWEYNLSTGDFDLLTNVQTGVFAPYLASDGKVYALEFSSDGMTPVTFPHRILHDANSIEYLGQKVLEANPCLADISTLKESLPTISFGSVYDSLTVYKPLKEARFQGAYPDISAFVDRDAWNNMTPVLGYHASFYDPLSLFKVNLFLGTSAWSNNEWKNKFHAAAEVKYMQWSLNAAWNPTSFYDLFGPRRASRTGYQLLLSYNTQRMFQSPFYISWGGSLGHYGGMDALPLFQNVDVDSEVHSFQTANAYVDLGRIYNTIGAMTSEQGYTFSASAYSYLAGGHLFPSVDLTGNLGFLLPFGQHNCFWLRGAAGQNFGDVNSTFGYSFFGGFRNNYVDNGTINRYRSASAMPGATIDQIAAHSYAKLTADFNFCPIKFSNLGTLQCYPNCIQFCLFGNGLVTDPWGKMRDSRENYYDVGAQMNIQMVFFTHMSATLSFGYARVWGGGLRQGEFMASLKLL